MFNCSVMSSFFATPWTLTHQAPLSIGVPRQEYWNGLPFPLQEIFPIQGSNPSLLHWHMGSFPLSHLGSLFFLTPKTFCMGVSKITVDGDYSHEIKRCLLLGRKVMTNLGSILKSRDITLPTKVHLVKAVVFSVVMYGCESWTVKKAERRRTDAFELWWWRRLLRVPWTEGDPTSPF